MRFILKTSTQIGFLTSKLGHTLAAAPTWSTDAVDPDTLPSRLEARASMRVGSHLAEPVFRRMDAHNFRHIELQTPARAQVRCPLAYQCRCHEVVSTVSSLIDPDGTRPR